MRYLVDFQIEHKLISKDQLEKACKSVPNKMCAFLLRSLLLTLMLYLFKSISS